MKINLTDEKMKQKMRRKSTKMKHKKTNQPTQKHNVKGGRRKEGGKA